MDVYLLLRKLGITANYIGYQYLVRAIELVLDNQDNLLLITKNIYMTIAKEYGTKTCNVERALRTVVQVCWERGNRQFLGEIAGYTLLQKPNTSSFIDMLSGYILRQREEAKIAFRR